MKEERRLRKITLGAVLLLFNLVFGLLAAKEVRADTDFSMAMPISVNQSVNGSVSNESSETREMLYRLSISRPGSLTIQFASPLQSSTDTYWKVYLYNYEYHNLCYREIYGNQSNTTLPSIGIPTGDYYVKVVYVRSEDAYSLNVNYEPSDYWEKEFNEDYTTATDIQLNSIYYGTTEDGYDYEKDYYKLQLPDSGVVKISFFNPLQNTDDNYWLMFLYDSEYHEICSRSISGNKSMTNMADVGLPQGVYYLRINSAYYNWYHNYSSDTYSFQVNFTPSANWEKEQNEEFTTATQIQLNTVYQGTIDAGYDYEKDYYKFDILTPTNYRIGLKTENLGNTDNYWNMYLYDQAYQIISSIAIQGNKTITYLDEFLATGTYYVLVQSASYNKCDTSPYQLRIVRDTRTVKNIKFTEKSITLWKGDTYELNYVVNPSTLNPTVRWSSSNKRVASVSSTGLVKAKRKGKATITITTSNGKQAKCRVTVR